MEKIDNVVESASSASSAPTLVEINDDLIVISEEDDQDTAVPIKRARKAVKCEPCEPPSSVIPGKKLGKSIKSTLMKISASASARTRPSTFANPLAYRSKVIDTKSFESAPTFMQPSMWTTSVMQPPMEPSTSTFTIPSPMSLPTATTPPPHDKTQQKMRTLLPKPYVPSMPDYDSQRNKEQMSYTPTEPGKDAQVRYEPPTSHLEPECNIESCSWGQHLSRYTPASPPPLIPRIRPVNTNQLMPPPAPPAPPAQPVDFSPEKFGWASPAVIHEAMAAQIYTVNIALNLRIKAQEAKIKALENLLTTTRASPGRPRKY